MNIINLHATWIIQTAKADVTQQLPPRAAQVSVGREIRQTGKKQH